MRQMIEIQKRELPRIAELAGELRKEVIRLIAEIRRDHWNLDEAEAWAIAFGRMPSFVAFRVKSHLHVIVEEILPDLTSNLREAAIVTDGDLVKEWQELWQDTWQPHEGAIH